MSERFWQKVRRGTDEECWEWTGAKLKSGYGLFGLGAHGMTYAHRHAYLLTYGDPRPFHVLHRCDNPACINPSHLFLGTHADNMQDRYRKNRHGGRVNPALVHEIRNAVGTRKELAKRFNLHENTIYHIRVRKTWKYL